ncbi:MAG: hypothetical protein ACRDVF_15605 [Microbacterium sp.]|uniref:hypothetical protein n=1 Tax=Microbacterium sp. TaxID=51671 RepID=UPI003D6EB76E
MTDDETEVEETVMLTRRDRRRGRPVAEPGEVAEPAERVEPAEVAEPAEPVEPAEPAEVAEPAEPADDVDEATVVVDRRPAEAEEPGADREDDPVDESTMLVSRTPRRVRRKRSEQPADSDDSADRAEADVPASFEAPTDAPAPEIYRPRPAPLGPSAPPVVIGAAAPTRTVDPDLPSVAKQGLRWSRAALITFAAACVVSVAGLVGLGFFVFG